MTAIEKVIESLERSGKVVACGQRKWMAKCPSHEDNRRSLCISQGNEDRVLLHCFAGCSVGSIVEGMGLSLRDLFSNNGVSSKVVDVYPYVDEQGTLLYEVLRLEGKEFRQKAADGTWNLNGVRRVPYHLPRLIEGVQQGKTIYVPEGEKDVHSIERRGGYATCNSGGAGPGKWLEEFAVFFRGADVVVIADKDKPDKQGRLPGLEHARYVMSTLDGVARTIRIVEALVGKDATDHLRAGHNASELVEIDVRETEAIAALKKVREEYEARQREASEELARIDVAIKALRGGVV